MALGTQPISDIFRKDLLFRFRAGGNVPRGTFSRADSTTCATYINHNGLVATAAANVLRVEWADLNSDGIFETPAILQESGLGNVLLRSEEFDNAAWFKGSATISANAATAPDGSATADQIQATASTAVVNQAVVINSTVVTYILHVHVGSGNTEGNSFGIRNATTATDILFGTLNYSTGAWTYTIGSAGVTVTKLAGGWFRIIMIHASGITSGNTLTFYVGFIGGGHANGQYLYAWGACATPGITASYVKTIGSTVSRTADDYKLSHLVGQDDFTVLAQTPRPFTCDAAAGADIGIWPGIFSLGTTNPNIEMYYQRTSRQISAEIRGTTANVTATSNIPSGTPIIITAQFKNLRTAGQAAIDVGSGLSAFTSSAGPISAWGDQLMRVGAGLTTNILCGMLCDLMFMRGLKSRQTMIALAGLA